MSYDDTHLDLDEINPHLGLLISENYVPFYEKAWFAWLRKVERMLGHGLDGNQIADGYSLDYAADAFDGRQTAEDYFLEVTAAKAELDAALGPCIEFPKVGRGRY